MLNVYIKGFVLGLFAAPAAANAQSPASAVVLGTAQSLADIRAVALLGTEAIVLTGSAPFLHRYHGGEHVASWGRAGAGPGELQDPVAVTWDERGILVVDGNQHRVVAFTASGAARWTRTLARDWIRGIALAGGDTLLELFTPMTQERAIVRQRGERRDTIWRYETFAESGLLRLHATGAPSLSVVPPYAATTTAAILADGSIASWRAGERSLEIRDGHGVVARRTPLRWAPCALVAADREEWLATAIPTEFMGKRVFEPLRAEARKSVVFPAVFPLVLGLRGDPAGGVWVQRSGVGGGATWSRLAGDGTEVERLRLPAGRQLLAIGPEEVAVKAESDGGEPIVERYRRDRRGALRPGEGCPGAT